MRTRGFRSAVLQGLFLVASVGVLAGCGDPEKPSIQNVRVYFQDPSDDEWKPLSSGGDSPASPIRIQGQITDNTAVVAPRLAVLGERQDVEDVEFSCPLEPNTGFYVCSTSFDAAALGRGQRISIRESEGGNEIQEADIQVSEIEDYRILRIKVVTEGAGDLVRSFYREVPGGNVRLRSGDSLRVGDPGSGTLRLSIKAPDNRAFSALTGIWERKVLSKWDRTLALSLDPTSGDFSATFQLFDPRPKDLQEEPGAPSYRFTLSAYDAPDQKEDLGRYAESTVALVFSPPRGEDTFLPKVELSGVDEQTESLSSQASSVTLSGRVQDNAGEVKWLRIRLSNTAVQGSGYRERVLYFNPAGLSLTGAFALNLRFVSDWNENGEVDVLENGEGVSNYLQIVAQDIDGNVVSFPESFFFEFVPPSNSTSPPAIDLVETFPELDATGQAALPTGEILRIRARATDDSGMPLVEEWVCPMCPELPAESWDRLNEDLCTCSLGERTSLDPSGQFPDEPWEWIDISSETLSQGTIHFLKAIKKVRTLGVSGRPPFSAREILQAEDGTDPQLAKIIPTETIGPIVAFQPSPVLADGTVVSEPDPGVPGNFIADFGTLSASIRPHFSQLNQVAARVVGGEILDEPDTCKQPSYRGDTGEFSWSLGRVSVREGSRVCVGAASLTGHATVYLWEFDEGAEGLRVSLVTSSELEACPQEPQDFPCPAGSD